MFTALVTRGSAPLLTALCVALVPSVALATPELSTPRFAGDRTGDDPYLAPSGNGGYDVTNYRVRLAYNPDNHGISAASATLRSSALQDLKVFSLDARPGLRIKSVRVNGDRAKFRRGHRKITIKGFGLVPAGDSFTIRLRYQGKPEPIRDPSGRERYGWLRTPGGSVTFTEPTGTSAWLPSNDVFYDKATWQVKIITPRGQLGVSTGLLKGIKKRGSHTVSKWRMNTPIQPYAQVIAIDRFDYSTRRIAGIPAFTAVAQSAPISVRTMRKRTGGSVRWLQARLGAYPFESTGGIVVSGGDSAMETAGRPTYSPESYYTSRGTVLHEQSHQWFGNTITAGQAADIWLHEGFATYLENVESAERRGVPLSDVVHSQYVYDGWSAGYHGQFHKVPLSDPTAKYLLNTTPYFRGQAALHALRVELGDSRFWAVLRGLAQEAAGRTTDTAAVIDRAEALSGRSLDSWAATWVHSVGYQRLPENPSHRIVLKEIGPGILDAAADFVWDPKGNPEAAMRRAIRPYAPMDQLVIDDVATKRDGKRVRYYVDFHTSRGALYPLDYRSCFVFEKRNSNILAGAYLGVKISTNYRQNTFTYGTCPA